MITMTYRAIAFGTALPMNRARKRSRPSRVGIDYRGCWR